MQATPLEVATGFAVFANGGYRVEPFYIDRIEGPGGQIVYSAEPKTVCAECVQPIVAVSRCRTREEDRSQRHHRAADSAAAGARRTEAAERVITPQVSFLMNDIMKDVITRGTGRRALALGRSDLRGKTGTTNLNPSTPGSTASTTTSSRVSGLATTTTGRSAQVEEGARTAVPIWVDYMREALARCARESRRTIPDGIVEMKVNAATGGTRDADLDPLFEYFRADMLPTEEGYVGDPGTSARRTSIRPLPNTPQSGADPIF